MLSRTSALETVSMNTASRVRPSTRDASPLSRFLCVLKRPVLTQEAVCSISREPSRKWHRKTTSEDDEGAPVWLAAGNGSGMMVVGTKSSC